jgi:putative hydrolase of the HAD superfamily
MKPKAVIFDLGGVVLDSPLHAIALFEERFGIAPGTVNQTVVASGANGAWARHERGEVDRATFLAAFRSEFLSRGIDVDTDALLLEIDASIRVRPAMLRAVDRVRRAGMAVAALTNNWEPFGDSDLTRRFDVVVESVVEGTRKPERRIYQICLERLALPASACVMFDDLGPNLNPAREMGMATVKVTSESQALLEVEALLG